MTVASQTSRNQYLGTGSTGPYPYSFRIFGATDLEVIKRNGTTGIETTLGYPGDYTVSGVGNGSGGSVALTQALASGDTLTIRRLLDVTQPASFRNQSRFLPEKHEDAFDRGTMVDQQHEDALGRTVSLSSSYDPRSYDLTLPLPAAGKALVWNVAGTGLDNATLSAAQLSAWSASQNMREDVFVGGVDFTAGVTTALTLSAAPGNAANMQIVRTTGGVPVTVTGDQYSVIGTTLTFGTAIPASTTRIQVRYLLTYQVNTVDSVNAIWNQSAAGAVVRSVRDRLRETLSVMDFGVVMDGSDQTANFQTAINSAAGRPLSIPPGTLGFTAVTNAPGKPLVLWGSGDHTFGTVLQQLAGANVGFSIARTAPVQFCDFRSFVLVGDAGNTNTGGVLLGDGTGGLGATNFCTYATFDRFRAINYRRVGGYGVSVEAAFLVDFSNCVINANYYNLWRPDTGFLTTVRFTGSAGELSAATNTSVRVDGAIIDMSFDAIAMEGNAGPAIYAVGRQTYIVMNGCYSEDNCRTFGNVFTISGAPGLKSTFIQRDQTYLPNTRAAAKMLDFDQAQSCRIECCKGLFFTGTPGADVVVTANSQVHFADDSFNADIVTILNALAATGQISYEDVWYVNGQRVMRSLTLSTDLTVGGAVKINGVNGSVRDVVFQTNNVNRWFFRGANSSGEAGANAGSDLQIIAFTDAGAVIDVPLLITRAAGGIVSIQRPVTVTGDLVASAKFGCNAAAAQAAFSLGVAAVDPATTMALVNLIRTLLINNGTGKV